MRGRMPPALPTARTITATATASPAPAVIDLLTHVALVAMSALVMVVSLLTVRDAAIESSPGASRFSIADPLPFGLVAIVGWLLLEMVVKQLHGPPTRTRPPHPVLLLVRLTLVACAVLVIAGPVAQFAMDTRTWLHELPGG